MRNRRFSFEEFKALFPRGFASPEDLLREYNSLLSVFEQLDRMAVPELSCRAKAEIFRRSWRQPRRDCSRIRLWFAFFRQPAATFALGIVFGCILMLAVLSRRPVPPRPTVANQPLTIERTRYMEVYKGRLVEELYPQIEDPKIVLEKPERASTSQRVLYGTLDDGEIYVVWNL